MSAVWLLALHTLISCNFAQICLWGRFAQNDKTTNGLYRATTETANGKPYWKLDRSGQSCAGSEDNYYYLFWIEDAPDTGWYVGQGLTTFGFSLGSILLAKCKNLNADRPSDCGSNWAFGIDSYADPFPDTNIDPYVSATEGRCPALDCATISVSSNGISNCLGALSQTGANEYTSASGEAVWYFNEPTFVWRCVAPELAEASCASIGTSSGLLNVGDLQEWQPASDGESFVYSTRSDSGVFTCAGAGFTTTYSPTTPNPTQPLIPTPDPTFIDAFPTAAPGSITSAPAVSITPAPVASSNGDDDDDDGDDDDSKEDNARAIFGGPIDDLWIWIIIVVCIICCCCCCAAAIYYQRKKKKDDQYFGTQDNL